jgi:hypothetical protein
MHCEIKYGWWKNKTVRKRKDFEDIEQCKIKPI